MSLIEEALRRVKDPLLAPPSPAPPQQQPPAPPAHSWTPEEAPPARSNSPLKSLVSPQTPTSLVAVGVAVLALTVVLLTGGVFWIGATLHSGGAPAPTAEAPDVAPEAVVEEPAVLEPPADAPQPAKPPAASAPALPRLRIQEPTPQTWPKLQTSPIVFTPNPLGRLRRKAPPQPLVLNGVVEGLGDPYAVINGSIVGLGERVGELTLQAITNGTVTLRSDDGEDTVLRVSSR